MILLNNILFLVSIFQEMTGVKYLDLNLEKKKDNHAGQPKHCPEDQASIDVLLNVGTFVCVLLLVIAAKFVASGLVLRYCGFTNWRRQFAISEEIVKVVTF